MTAKLNIDDLVFAKVRAKYFEPPGEVADGLIEAARHPERLDGVTGLQALHFAAVVLIQSGNYQTAIDLLRRVSDSGIPDEDLFGNQFLAQALIATGEVDEAEALIRARSAASAIPFIPLYIGMIDFASKGYFEHARRCLAALDDPDVSYMRSFQESAQRAREKLEALAQAGSARVAESGARQSEPSPGSGFTTLWWPEAEYVKLERHLPELTAIIGSPWRLHVASVEASLRFQARGGYGKQLLLPAEFDEFVDYLLAADVDPRTRTALDGFATPGRETGDWLVPTWIPDLDDATAWPPGPKEKCWCGSRHRYKNCCGAASR